MVKILLLALAIWLLIVVLKRYSRSVEVPPENNPKTKPQDMVQCVYCGVHLPKNESVLTQGKYYCCEAHSQQREP